MEPISQDKIRFCSKLMGSAVLLKPMLKKMRIAEIIDRVCPSHPQQLVSHGTTIEVLVCNRLLSPQPFYLVEQWAEQSGTKEVYGIEPSLLNDDRLAKTLDALNGSRNILKTEIVLQVAKTFQIPLEQIHWDITSFHFTGDYEAQKEDHIKIVYSKDHPQRGAVKSAKIGLNMVKDEYGAVPLWYEDLDGNTSGLRATMTNMENLKKYLNLDKVLRINDRGCFSPEVALKTTKGTGFDFISSVTFSKSYEELFLACLGQGVNWERLSYLSINQQKRPEGLRDYYYGFETNRTLAYNGQEQEIRVIFIKSDGKKKREEKTEAKRLNFINEGFKRINSLLGKPRYRTIPEVAQRIKSVLGKHPDYGSVYSYEVITDGAGKPVQVAYFLNETALMRKRMLYGVYVLASSLDKKEYCTNRVFGLFKDQYTAENANKVLKGPIRLRPIFLHRPERIEGLILVTFLALMVYYLLERMYYYHQKEQEKQETKKGEKILRKMTARRILWIFNWYSLGIIRIGEQEVIKPAELTEEQQEIFNILELAPPSQWLGKG